MGPNGPAQAHLIPGGEGLWQAEVGAERIKRWIKTDEQK